jgi:hypothetical protein
MLCELSRDVLDAFCVIGHGFVNNRFTSFMQGEGAQASSEVGPWDGAMIDRGP